MELAFGEALWNTILVADRPGMHYLVARNDLGQMKPKYPGTGCAGNDGKLVAGTGSRDGQQAWDALWAGAP